MVTEAERGAPTEGVSGSSTQTGSTAHLSAAGSAHSSRTVGRYFLAAFLSLYGDWLTTVALVVVLFEVTHSAAAPAGYMLVRVAPRVLGPWMGGRLTDWASPRAVMVAASLVQGAFTTSLIASHRVGMVWAMYLAVAGAQFVGALGRPSQGSILPVLVGDRDLPRANAILGIFFSTSIFVAPAIGAALLLRIGPDPLFAIDAGTFVLSALLFITLPSGKQLPTRAADRSAQAKSATGALLRALRQPQIRMVAAANFASGLVVTVTQAFLVVAAHERFGGDSFVGYLYSSVGVGGALGGLIALRWIPPRTWTRLSVFSAVTIEVIAIAWFSAASGVLLGLLLLAVSAATGSSFDAWGATEIQRSAPPGFMGRFNSVIFISMYSGMLVGAVWALATASVLHWDIAIEFACAAVLTFLAIVWVVGAQERLPETENEP